MKSAMRWLVTTALVTLFVTAWSATISHNRIGAQATSKTIVMKRVYTGTDGLSHVEDMPLEVSSMMEKVTSNEVRVSQPGSFINWHPGPQRQYVINLAGSAQYEVAEGKVDLVPGSMAFIDDLTGKGHTTRVTSKEPRVDLWLKFEDQKQRIGPLNAKPTTSLRP